MVFEINGTSNAEIIIEGETMEVVDKFLYLGSVLEKRGDCMNEINHRVLQGRTVAYVAGNMVKKHNLSLESARALYESLLAPTILYGSETLYMKEQEKSRVRAIEMDYLRKIVGVRRTDKVRNTMVREICGVKAGVDGRRERLMLGWFGHMNRMDDARTVKRIYVSECEGRGLRGRPRKEWKDGVEEYLVARGRSINGVHRLVRDRDEWKKFVRGGTRA